MSNPPLTTGTTTTINRILVDNWLLSHVSRLLGPGFSDTDKYELKDDPYPYLVKVPKPSIFSKKKKSWPITVTRSMIALMQFLDLLAIGDELIYDDAFSYAWKTRLEIKESLLVSVRIGDETKKHLPELIKEGKQEDDDKTPEVISEGTRYYSSLAQFLGIYYWPTPERAEYLATHKFFSVTPVFSVAVNEFVDQNLKGIADLVRDFLPGIESPISFPGFGSAVLANCAKSDDILPTILEFRKTRECVAFRAWLSQMDHALEKGDLTALAHSMTDLKEVVASVERGLGIKNPTLKVDMQIGLSPSITLDTQTLDSIRKGLTPKKLHITFLRRHFVNVLQQANTWHTLQRLFPIIKDVHGVN